MTRGEWIFWAMLTLTLIVFLVGGCFGLGGGESESGMGKYFPGPGSDGGEQTFYYYTYLAAAVFVAGGVVAGVLHCIKTGVAFVIAGFGLALATKLFEYASGPLLVVISIAGVVAGVYLAYNWYEDYEEGKEDNDVS